jgi:hypothetical protein
VIEKFFVVVITEVEKHEKSIPLGTFLFLAIIDIFTFPHLGEIIEILCFLDFIGHSSNTNICEDIIDCILG